jgi:surface polysaccharide O-acyltransferase-like enzyme
VHHPWGGASALLNDPSALHHPWGRASALLVVHPLCAFALLALASAVAYLPMVALFGPLEWFTWGPFTVQTSRLLHYALYFAAGVAMGARGIDAGWLAERGALARRAAWWCASGVIAFIALTALVIVTPPAAPAWQSLLTSATFVISCATSSFALLALFLRAGTSQSLAWRGLRDSAYGIYVVHFAVAAWMHYALRAWHVDALAKGVVVLALTLGTSWALASAARRMPGLRRIL